MIFKMIASTLEMYINIIFTCAIYFVSLKLALLLVLVLMFTPSFWWSFAWSPFGWMSFCSLGDASVRPNVDNIPWVLEATEIFVCSFDTERQLEGISNCWLQLSFLKFLIGIVPFVSTDCSCTSLALFHLKGIQCFCPDAQSLLLVLVVP